MKFPKKKKKKHWFKQQFRAHFSGRREAKGSVRLKIPRQRKKEKKKTYEWKNEIRDRIARAGRSSYEIVLAMTQVVGQEFTMEAVEHVPKECPLHPAE